MKRDRENKKDVLKEIEKKEKRKGSCNIQNERVRLI